MKEFIETEIQDSDKPGLLALNDPNPTGPTDMKMVRIHQNNTYGHGLFLIISRMNHSCKPVVEISSDDGMDTEVRAITDIMAGQEITVSYLRSSSLLSKAERTEKLLHWGFQCSCLLCSLAPEEQNINDREREKVRKSMELIKKFFSLLSRDSKWPTHDVKPYIEQVFVSSKESLTILEGNLRGEAEPAIVAILLYLAALAEVAGTAQFQTALPGTDTPSQFLERARGKARMMGTMFLSDCDTREADLLDIRMTFGKGDQHIDEL